MIRPMMVGIYCYILQCNDGKGLHKNKLLIIEEVILCANKAKNV